MRSMFKKVLFLVLMVCVICFVNCGSEDDEKKPAYVDIYNASTDVTIVNGIKFGDAVYQKKIFPEDYVTDTIYGYRTGAGSYPVELKLADGSWSSVSNATIKLEENHCYTLFVTGSIGGTIVFSIHDFGIKEEIESDEVHEGVYIGEVSVLCSDLAAGTVEEFDGTRGKRDHGNTQLKTNCVSKKIGEVIINR